MTKHSSNEKQFIALQLQYDGKEQECMTLASFNQVQTQQINQLQMEISKMIERLENIKDQYENEIEQRDVRLNSTKNLALNQLK